VERLKNGAEIRTKKPPFVLHFSFFEITEFLLKLLPFLFKHLHPSSRSKKHSFIKQKGEGIGAESTTAPRRKSSSNRTIQRPIQVDSYTIRLLFVL
jgi:hypothetical protein